MSKVFDYFKKRSEKGKAKKAEKAKEKHQDEVYNRIQKEFGCVISSDYIDVAEVILNCDNQEIIYNAFCQEDEDDLKKLILKKLTDKKYLEKIVFEPKFRDFQCEAMLSLDSQEVYEKVLLNKSYERSVRYTAVQNLKEKDDKFWYDIIVSQEVERYIEDFLFACFRKISSQQVLADIVKLDTKSRLEKLYKKSKNGYHSNIIFKFEEIEKKKIAVEFITDQDISKDLLLNFYLQEAVRIAIIQKLENEVDLMEAFRKYFEEDTLTSEIVSRIEALGHVESLLELIIKSEDKEFISRNIEKITDLGELCMIKEKSKFWYAVALADAKIKELSK